jgi:CDP-glucose 4,6-dehydratase
VFVNDAVTAYRVMAEQADHDGVRGETFNFGPSSPLTVLDVVSLIQRLMDQKDLQPVIQNTATHEIRDQFLSSAKARDKLKWVPKYSMEEGLRSTIQWYKDFLPVKG